MLPRETLEDSLPVGHLATTCSPSRLRASQPEKSCLEVGGHRQREAWEKLALKPLSFIDLENQKTEPGHGWEKTSTPFLRAM